MVEKIAQKASQKLGKKQTGFNIKNPQKILYKINAT